MQLADLEREQAVWASLPHAPPRAWREAELLRFVRRWAAGRAAEVLVAAEDFCASRKVWLKVAGGRLGPGTSKNVFVFVVFRATSQANPGS